MMKFLTVLSSTCLLSRVVSGYGPYSSPGDPLRMFKRREDRSLATESPAADPTTGVICSLAGSAPAGEIETHTIKFYYALGTNNTTLDTVQSFDLQQKLFRAVEQSISWCYEEGDPESTETSERRGRALLRAGSSHRKLGILAVTVGPTETNIGALVPVHADFLSTDMQVYAGALTLATQSLLSRQLL